MSAGAAAAAESRKNRLRFITSSLARQPRRPATARLHSANSWLFSHFIVDRGRAVWTRRSGMDVERIRVYVCADLYQASSGPPTDEPGGAVRAFVTRGTTWDRGTTQGKN